MAPPEEAAAAFVVLPDAGAVARRAAEEFVARADDAVARAGRFAVALSGGSTPRRTYSLLADPAAPFRAAVDWARVHFFWGDERPVPPDDRQSNYRMARETLLSHVPVPADNVHRIEGEKPAEEAARGYESVLREFFRPGPGDFPRLDLIFLGMGEDGHTASLFPGTDALAERTRWVAAPWVPKLSTRRITLTFPVLNAASAVFFLVCGADKAPVARGIRQGDPASRELPSARVRPTHGELVWLLDSAAAGKG